MPILARVAPVSITSVWLLAPLLGRLGPFLYLCLLPFGLRRNAGGRVPGLAGFLLLAAAYAGFTTLMALLTATEGVRVFPSIREALHLAVPVAIAAIAFRMTDIPQWRIVYRGAVVVLLAALLIGLIFQYRYAVPQPEFLASNPLYLGASLLYPAVICLFPARDDAPVWRIAGPIAVIATAAMLGMVTQSRAYFLLLLVIVAIRLFSVLAGKIGTARAVLVTGGALALLPLLILSLTPDGARQRFVNLGQIPALAAEMWAADPAAAPLDAAAGHDMSLRARIAMLVAATSAFAEAPLLGHGAPNKYLAAVPHMPDSYARHTDLEHLHNELANQAVAHGIVGLALMLALVLYPVWHARRMGVLGTWRGGFAALTAFASFGIGLGNVLLMTDYPAYLFAVNSIGAIMMITAGAQRPSGAEPDIRTGA